MDEVTAQAKYSGDSKNYHVFEIGNKGEILVGKVYVSKAEMPTPAEEITITVQRG